MFAFGMNGVPIGPDSRKNIEALKKADWLVVGEIYPDETSEFWKSPGITPEEMKNINTTVYRAALCGLCRERWLVHQFRALAAMEERGGSAAGRLPPGPSHRGANLPQGARALQERRRKISRIRFLI